MLSKLSIGQKLGAAIVLACTLTLAVTVVSLGLYDYSSQKRIMAEETAVLADVFGANLDASLRFKDAESAASTLAALQATPLVELAMVLTADKRVFASYQRSGKSGRPGRILPEQPGTQFMKDRLVVMRKIASDGEQLGFIYFEAGLDILHARFKRFLVIVAGVLATALLFAVNLAIRLQRVIAAPIIALTSTARTISETSDYSVRAEHKSGDEVGVLVDGFNEMLERVQTRDAELEAHKASLKKKVSRRHKELAELFAVMESQATSGDLSTRAVVHTDSDVGQIASRYNNLIESLEGAHHELQTERKSLRREIQVRKDAETELFRYTKRLEVSNKELAEFAYVASHDLQEPLRKVQAFGDRLKLKCETELSDTGRDYLDRMQSAAARMQALIADLLSFSRLTNQPKPFAVVNLDSACKHVLQDLEVRIDELSATVTVDPLPAPDADPTQMKQLLQNLIANALKFHRKGVAPEIHVWSEALDNDENVIEDARTDDDRVVSYRLYVKDNGIGFDEKYLTKIFGVFQRLHGRAEYEGTGVGLALCRRIAERHGGTITARSTPGEGATFIVTILAKQEHSEVTATDGGKMDNDNALGAERIVEENQA